MEPNQLKFQAPLAAFAPAFDYVTDAVQRGVLFLDVLRRRGNQYHEHLQETVPNVLDYQAELVLDGRTLNPPVNYLLARAVPPEGTLLDPLRRPFVIIDPRAGHGPGIAGFKADSEIGAAFKAGHPCYVVGFFPEPVPGQTIEHIARAEAAFLEKVIALHPDADGKPCVIGNCQAGWAVMMLAALRPELFGPIIAAGAPLSYWAGVRGKNPMRYSGGLTGGSWINALLGDLGMGRFDGAWLVQNFENQNPANTLWTKQYDLYSRVDTEAARYLQFEKWWGGHVTLNTEEIQFIVDQLFVGNHLAAGNIRTATGAAVDLRNIRSPILVFCSRGDNITPPQQALDWILDLYQSVDDIRACDQTIVYCIHETAGHLGIFVSGSVARKEHGQFTSNIDLIDTLPPGLYEAVLEEKHDGTARADLASGNWIMRCETRTLDDIRALGGNDAADQRRFATAARLSEINLALYRTFAQPLVRACVTPLSAEWSRRAHPLRLQYEVFSDANPLMASLAPLAVHVREQRKPAAADNVFLAMQERVSNQIVAGLDAWRQMSEAWAERSFLALYGQPALQKALGIDPESTRPLRSPAKSPLHYELRKIRKGELMARIDKGGMPEAIIRALLYIGMTEKLVDERSFELVRRLRLAQSQMSLAAFKAIVREQFYLLLLDQDKALAALPAMLPPDEGPRRLALEMMRQVLEARGTAADDNARLAEIAALFGVSDGAKGSVRTAAA